MSYLLDVNVLLALGHLRHVHQRRVAAWYVSLPPSSTRLLTCSITELGFVRISVQTKLHASVAESREALARLKASSRIPLVLVSDPLGVDCLPDYVTSPAGLTDGHLLEVAKVHGAQLASLDGGIPGAFLIP